MSKAGALPLDAAEASAPRFAIGERCAGLLERQAGRFALWLPVAAMAGDACYFGLAREPPPWFGAALLAIGCALAAPRRAIAPTAAGLVLALFGFGFGAAQWAALRAPPFPALPSRAALISGRITDRDALPDGARLLLDRITVDGAAIGPRRLRLRADPDPALTPGAIVSLRGMVAPPPPPAYPGARDPQRDAWFGGLAGSGYALGPVRVLRPGAPEPLAALRDRIAGRIRAVLPGSDGAIAATLLTGLSAAIPQADRDAFRDAGLAHLLAIAGLHIGIVMALTLTAVRALLLRSERLTLFWPVRQIAAAAALGAGSGYLVLTGLHVPTLRATAMASLVVLGLLVGRRALSLRSWGFAALAVIALQPAELTGPSFQLSFAAVLALIAGYEVLREPLRRLRGPGGAVRRLGHHMAALALTSLLAGVASIPFIAFQFGRVQLYFVVANLLAVPLTAIWVMPAGMIALGLMPLGLDRLALIPMGWGIDLILWVARGVAGWPGATIAVPHVPVAALLPIALGLGWLCIWRGRLRLLGLAPVAAGCLGAALLRPPDLLVSATGRLVGWHAHATLYARALRGGDSFVLEAWQRHLGAPARDIAAAPSPAACTASGCALPGRWPARIGLPDAACGGVAVWIAQAGALPYCPHTLAIDRGFTWRNGAVAIWLAASPRLVTDRDARGARPWVFLPPEQRRAELGLPMAPAEDLPPRTASTAISTAAAARSGGPAP